MAKSIQNKTVLLNRQKTRRIRDLYSALPLTKRRLFFTLGSITVAFVIFSLVTSQDLLSPSTAYEAVGNFVPIVISILGIIASLMVLKGKSRSSSYLLMVGVVVGLSITAIFESSGIYSVIAGLLIVVIPVMIAIQSLSEREFTWIVILTLCVRSAIQILGTNKSSGSATGLSAQTKLIAHWASAIGVVFLALFVAFNLNNYPLRVKMILVFGLFTIIPTSIITSLSSRDLESNWVNQANRN